jgi:hypothetical protein
MEKKLYKLRFENRNITIGFIQAQTENGALNGFAKNLGFEDYESWRRTYSADEFLVTASLCKI